MTRRAVLARWAGLFLPIAAVWIVSFILRWGDWRGGFPSMEATYHSQLTIEALMGNHLGDHLGLPSVSLPGDPNHGIPWGATVPRGTGAYVYTSFPPLGWIVPALGAKLLGATPSPAYLFGFGALLGLVSALALGWVSGLLFDVDRPGRARWWAPYLGSVVALAYLFAPEALLSQGVTYWPHALSQVFWIMAVGLFVLWLRDRTSTPRAAGLLAALFLYCMTEWSGYFAALGTFVMLLAVARIKRERAVMVTALWLAGTTVLAALVTVAHFAWGIGLHPLLESWRLRFFVRSSGSDRLSLLIDLHRGFGQSFGFLLLGLVILLVAALGISKSTGAAEDARPFLLVIAMSATPLFENYVLLQHATQFSFDRLKWLVPIVLAVSYAAVEFRGRQTAIPAALMTLVALLGFLTYSTLLSRDSAVWKPLAASNQKAAGWVSDQLSDHYGCSTFSYTGGVRGYLNTTFRHGIFEGVVDLDTARTFTQRRGGCATVFIVGTPIVLPSGAMDLASIDAVTIVHTDGRESEWRATR